ncbi:cytochrome P450 [Frankia sp. CNm7]|uniref:Cytochrome P450 n=1 Tax=Frankia nepalensis TaxID=1836974 RepID=A0A937RH52_9ACTN|nr:cytochrome P450 [Frankia nepalensis]MBL7502393.1 cytochrome P450 [Frankia nepalensis]MBL7515899.1 cytochrome P450 [Frankia nepalensis]MBL7520016.1 cytochrome P450 [Frankia nepalensis]MBL7625946.1 cytochrome P450 [Frankia nepalensis]
MAPQISLDSIDVYDPEVYVAGVPHEQFAVLRAQSPVFHHPDHEQPRGFWTVTRHADVTFVSRNPEIFSSHRQTCFLNEQTPQSLAEQQLMMVNMDPPDHTRLRGLLNRGFTPRSAARLAGKIEAACDVIVDKALATGSGDFVTMCAAELPLVVIAELMGVPHEDRYKLFEWSNRMLAADDPDLSPAPDEGVVAAAEAYAYANELGRTKRACPVDDIVSKLVTPDENGLELTELEFDLFFILLIVAGNETTRNAISGGMQALIDNPEQWERLRADPARMARRAADEMVRWVSPVMAFRRTATRDVELGGQLIRENDKVLMYYTSANFDDEVFENPHAFDIGRDPNPHVGFGGGGPHFCLGRHLALLEIEIMYRALARRVAQVVPTAEPRRLRSNFINGVKEMQVRLVPAD